MPGLSLLTSRSSLLRSWMESDRSAGRGSRLPSGRVGVESLFASAVETVRTVAWNEGTGSVEAVERRRLGAIVLAERAVRADPGDLATALLDALLERGILAREDLTSELSRLAFANAVEPRASYAAD